MKATPARRNGSICDSSTYQEAGHAVVGVFSRRTDPLDSSPTKVLGQSGTRLEIATSNECSLTGGHDSQDVSEHAGTYGEDHQLRDGRRDRATALPPT